VSLREKLAKRARPYLEPDEQVQAVFITQSGPSPYWQFLIGLFGLVSTIIVIFYLGHTLVANVLLVAIGGVLAPVNILAFPCHHVVVSDRAIVVIDASKVIATFPTRLRLRHPRDFYFGRLSGFYGKFLLYKTKYWVQRRFYNDLAAADAALTAMMERR